ncbi:MAG: adenylate/guanylate cyclase domain-containing protein [Deltaproteobacteria bacterium]|jgi:class 3 adenylate cyclase
MAQYCCQPNENTLILAYADRSNIRQFSNQASVDLAREGFGKLICLAGSRPNNGFTQSEKNPGHWEGSQKWGEVEKVACLLHPLTGTASLPVPCLSIGPTETTEMDHLAPGRFPAVDYHNFYSRNPERKLCALLSADVEGYSRLMGEDEFSTVQTLQTCQKVIGAIVKQFRGRVVDSPGDNILSEFASVVDAVECAVIIQNELKILNAESPENRRMKFRIGINVGDVIEHQGRLYGDGVNIAARIENLAEGGEIYISGTVHDQVERKLPLEYQYLGRKKVKNIFKPLPVYRILTEAQPKEGHWRNLSVFRKLLSLFKNSEN